MLAETNLIVMVTPSKDLEGKWAAHCLDIDLVSQGDTIHHAFLMAQEAILEVVRDDLEHGLNPLERAEAPEECWAQLSRVVRKARPLSSIEDEKRVSAAVVQFRLLVPRDALPAHARPSPPEIEMLPPAWQIAALKDLRNSEAAQN